jgi:hypothetical protein
LPTRSEIVQLYLDAQSTRVEAAIAAAAEHIAPDATMTSARGTVEGRDAIVDRFTSAPYAAMLGTVTWSEPAEAGDEVSTSCDMPENPMGFKRMTLTFGFGEGDLIIAIAMAMQS